MKAHLHSEQFDNCLHAECGAADGEGHRILLEDAFEALPRSERCHKCSAYNWPFGEGFPVGDALA